MNIRNSRVDTKDKKVDTIKKAIIIIKMIKCGKCGGTDHAKGFYCQASKFKFQNCHKVGHFSPKGFKTQKDNNV